MVIRETAYLLGAWVWRPCRLPTLALLIGAILAPASWALGVGPASTAAQVAAEVREAGVDPASLDGYVKELLAAGVSPADTTEGLVFSGYPLYRVATRVILAAGDEEAIDVMDRVIFMKENVESPKGKGIWEGPKKPKNPPSCEQYGRELFATGLPPGRVADILSGQGCDEAAGDLLEKSNGLAQLATALAEPGLDDAALESRIDALADAVRSAGLDTWFLDRYIDTFLAAGVPPDFITRVLVLAGYPSYQVLRGLTERSAGGPGAVRDRARILDYFDDPGGSSSLE